MIEKDDIYDVIIIGGGINGCGIARDAVGRGLRTALVEAKDLASATSSSSSKLVHGGLRYLEMYEFSLVKKALAEREILLKNAPHIIWPLEFVLPHEKHLRPKWMIRIGLFLYDSLAKRNILPASRHINFKKEPLFAKNLKPHLKDGFSYYDCWVDDARLVTLNALDAKENGAFIQTQTVVTDIFEKDGLWLVHLNNGQTLTGKTVVNAAGPWANDFLLQGEAQIKLVKGSHIVVPRIYDEDHAYILQNKDSRIVFAIPYEGKFTLIGTTDIAHDDEPRKAKPSKVEKDYLLTLIHDYFDVKLTEKDIVWSYSGVRPLIDDGAKTASKVTRDYKFEFKNGLLHILGGKITTYRVLAEQAVNQIQDYLKQEQKPWTKDIPLPGGDIFNGDFEDLLETIQKDFSAVLSKPTLYRMARAYGTRAYDFLSDKNLGQHFGEEIYQAEIDYLIEVEFATCLEDILWRRSKLGLHLSKETILSIENYIHKKMNFHEEKKDEQIRTLH